MDGESPSGKSEPRLTGLVPGSFVAGYRVESRIGAGGMGVVFRAYDEAFSRTVALKALAPALAGNAEFREWFIRKSRAVGAVVHPHIIPVFGAGEADGVLYLAMRFVAGGDLRAVLKREGQLTGDRVIACFPPSPRPWTPPTPTAWCTATLSRPTSSSRPVPGARSTRTCRSPSWRTPVQLPPRAPILLVIELSELGLAGLLLGDRVRRVHAGGVLVELSAEDQEAEQCEAAEQEPDHAEYHARHGAARPAGPGPLRS